MRYTGAGWVDHDGEPIELPAEPPLEPSATPAEPDVLVDDPREVKPGGKDPRKKRAT